MMKFEVGLDNLPIVESSRGKLNSSSFERYPLTHPCPTKAETTGILEKQNQNIKHHSRCQTTWMDSMPSLVIEATMTCISSGWLLRSSCISHIDKKQNNKHCSKPRRQTHRRNYWLWHVRISWCQGPWMPSWTLRPPIVPWSKYWNKKWYFAKLLQPLKAELMELFPKWWCAISL